MAIAAQRFDSTGIPLGSEITVAGTGDNFSPGLSVDAAGGFVVSWERDVGFPDADVFARRYDASGVALGGEFQVNRYTTGFQVQSAIAGDPAGNFVVVWRSDPGQDGDGHGIFGRRYDATGSPQGGEFQVNTFTTANQYDPDVGADATGNFVVVWTSQHGGSLSTAGRAAEARGRQLQRLVGRPAGMRRRNSGV